jgi:hypothetical protein
MPSSWAKPESPHLFPSPGPFSLDDPFPFSPLEGDFLLGPSFLETDLDLEAFSFVFAFPLSVEDALVVNSITLKRAPSPGRCPALKIRVYPPCRS